MYRIKVHQYYYEGTLNAPPEESWQKDEFGNTLSYKKKEDAVRYLDSWLTPKENNTWVHTGKYSLSQGEYSAPSFELVKI